MQLIHIAGRHRLALSLAAATLAVWSAADIFHPAFAREPLMVQDQGSFAAGGSLATEPGSFDPKQPLKPAGQTYEPGSGFVFPEGEVPAPTPTSFDTLQGVPVPMSEFLALTRIPIVIYYGDNIPTVPTDVPTQDAWRGRLEMARLWRDAVNRHGGKVSLVHLPEIGIRGNTHFPFSDLNNNEIADLVSKFLDDNDLD